MKDQSQLKAKEYKCVFKWVLKKVKCQVLYLCVLKFLESTFIFFGIFMDLMFMKLGVQLLRLCLPRKFQRPKKRERK